VLLAATVRSFAHMPLGISDRNSYIAYSAIDSLVLYLVICLSDLISYTWLHNWASHCILC